MFPPNFNNTQYVGGGGGVEFCWSSLIPHRKTSAAPFPALFISHTILFHHTILFSSPLISISPHFFIYFTALFYFTHWFAVALYFLERGQFVLHFSAGPQQVSPQQVSPSAGQPLSRSGSLDSGNQTGASCCCSKHQPQGWYHTHLDKAS